MSKPIYFALVFPESKRLKTKENLGPDLVLRKSYMRLSSILRLSRKNGLRGCPPNPRPRPAYGLLWQPLDVLRIHFLFGPLENLRKSNGSTDKLPLKRGTNHVKRIFFVF